jgi:hypothetical protein
VAYAAAMVSRAKTLIAPWAVTREVCTPSHPLAPSATTSTSNTITARRPQTVGGRLPGNRTSRSELSLRCSSLICTSDLPRVPAGSGPGDHAQPGPGGQLDSSRGTFRSVASASAASRRTMSVADASPVTRPTDSPA